MRIAIIYIYRPKKKKTTLDCKNTAYLSIFIKSVLTLFNTTKAHYFSYKKLNQKVLKERILS